MNGRRRTSNPVPSLLHAVLAHGAGMPSHERLAELAGIGDRSVENAVSQHGSIRALTSGRGLRLGPGLGLVLSLSMGAESLRAGLVDANGVVHARQRWRPLPGQLELSPAALSKRINGIARDVLRAAMNDEALWSGSRQSLRLLGCAMAWPTPVDRSFRPRGKALKNQAWTRASSRGSVIPLTTRLADALPEAFSPERCHALNDVNAQALAYAFRRSRSDPRDNEDRARWQVALVVRVGGGIGAATILLAPHDEERLAFLDSRLIGGTQGFAGELGHVPIARATVDDRNGDDPHGLEPLDYDGWRCSCGRRYHLEAFASGTALVRRLQLSGYEVPENERSSTGMIRPMVEGEPDEVQAHAVEDVGRLIGRALAAPVLMLDPESITLTGSLAGENLKRGLQAERDHWRNTIGDNARVGFIGRRQDGDFLAVQGAGLAVLRRHVFRRFGDGITAVRRSSFEFTGDDLDRW